MLYEYESERETLARKEAEAEAVSKKAEKCLYCEWGTYAGGKIFCMQYECVKERKE